MQHPTTLRPGSALGELEALKADFGEGSADRKAGLLLILEKASLKSAGEVQRLHEVAAFLRAHPDDRQVLTVVERLLGNAGIVRHRGKIESTLNNAKRARELESAQDSLSA